MHTSDLEYLGRRIPAMKFAFWMCKRACEQLSFWFNSVPSMHFAEGRENYIWVLVNGTK